jgi:toxin YoeB
VKLIWASQALADYRYFQAFEPSVAQRINELIEDIVRSPISGIGKPEPLRGELSGFWSRRITKKHRLVYRIAGSRGKNQCLEIAKCRLHY